MSNSSPPFVASLQSAADAPAARSVVFDIGVILAVHLGMALAVSFVLAAFAIR